MGRFRATTRRLPQPIARDCASCGVAFSTVKVQQLYCSKACRDKKRVRSAPRKGYALRGPGAYRDTKKICPCGAPVIRRGSANVRYCMDCAVTRIKTVKSHAYKASRGLCECGRVVYARGKCKRCGT